MKDQSLKDELNKFRCSIYTDRLHARRVPQPTGFQPRQRPVGSLRGTGGVGPLGCPTMIGATGTQPAGRLSPFFASAILRKLRAKSIQQRPCRVIDNAREYCLTDEEILEYPKSSGSSTICAIS